MTGTSARASIASPGIARLGIASLESLRRIFHHFVGGRDHLGIDLIGALRLDHVDEFLDAIDVRSFEHPPAQAATPFLPRTADQRRARGLRLELGRPWGRERGCTYV